MTEFNTLNQSSVGVSFVKLTVLMAKLSSMWPTLLMFLFISLCILCFILPRFNADYASLEKKQNGILKDFVKIHKFSFFLDKKVYQLILCTFILFIKGNYLLNYYSWSVLGLHEKESCEFSFAGSSYFVFSWKDLM